MKNSLESRPYFLAHIFNTLLLLCFYLANFISHHYTGVFSDEMRGRDQFGRTNQTWEKKNQESVFFLLFAIILWAFVVNIYLVGSQ